MSLFDILKYQNTDLTSESELLNLPEALVQMYWNHFWSGSLVVDNRYHSSHADKCNYLSYYVGRSGYIKFAQESFNKVLKEYYNEPL